MTAATLALVLASAALHATWNLWAKQIGGESRATSLIWLLTSISAAVYAPLALLSLRSGPAPDLAAIGWMVGSSVIHVGYFFLLLRGYRAGDLSLVYPVARGTGPLLAAAGAMLWLGEPPTVGSVAGALLVAGAVFILSATPRREGERSAAPGIAYGLAIGVTIAAYTLWDGTAVKRLAITPLVFYWGGEVCRTVLLAPLAVQRRADIANLWRTHRWRVLGIALLSPLSYMLMLFAMKTGALSHVAPAREVSILFGTWLGGRYLGESQRLRRVLAAAAFALGVIALTVA